VEWNGMKRRKERQKDRKKCSRNLIWICHVILFHWYSLKNQNSPTLQLIFITLVIFLFFDNKIKRLLTQRSVNFLILKVFRKQRYLK
jgi:hypothetical protein